MDVEKKNLNEEEIQNLINEIRKWMKEKFTDARTDDYYILRYIEACKYRPETIKHKLESDYHFRRNTPEWYKNRDPEGEDVKGLFTAGVPIFPEIHDEKGRRILFERPCYHDVKYSGDDYYKCMAMAFDEVTESDPSTTKSGVVLILDLEGICFTHCMKKTMPIKKVMHWWLNTLPMRIQEIHFLRFPSYATYFLNLAKSFMKEKMKKRFIIHKDMGDLKNVIDPKLLPKEYGGTNGSINDMADLYAKNVFAKRQWFLDNSVKN